jgi:hypothetical protein
MGTGSSSSRSREVSVCLDEDVFGKINNQLPNTAVPIEIKPKRRLNGGQRRVSLRGDSVNKSSSFFSNISSNNLNGSFVSFVSINKSEYKRQNEKLKHELNDIKSKMSSQIQTLLSSNLALKDQNVKLKSEINEIKSSRNKIHKELVCALDDQLAMKENVLLYQHKVNELKNVITVQGKDVKNHGTSSNSSNSPYSVVIGNQIVSTFLEFMISFSQQHNYELNSFSSVSICKRKIIIYVCKTLDETVSTKIVSEILRLFSSLVSNFMLSNVYLVTNSLTELRDCCVNCESVIIIDDQECLCSMGTEVVTGLPVHHLKYCKTKRMGPPIEEVGSLLTKYRISEQTLTVDVQLFVLTFWECDVNSFAPLVFDYASFFMYCSQGLMAQKLAQISSQASSRSFSEFDFYLKTIKKSLYVSCSKTDSYVFMAHLRDLFRGELIVTCEVIADTTFEELTQAILASLFYQVRLDHKFVTVSNESVFDVIDYLSLYFKVIIVLSIRSNVVTRCLERFLLPQKRSQSICVVLGTAVFVQVIKLCDSVYLSESHTPALKLKSKMRTLKSLISLIDPELLDFANNFTRLLTIFKSGVSDSCLLNLLNIPVTIYFTLKRTLLSLNIVCDDLGLIKLMPEMTSQEGNLTLKKLVSQSLRHIKECPCNHLHLRDLPHLLEVSRSLEVAHAITNNPEALAFHLYHNSPSTLMQSLKNCDHIDDASLTKEFLCVYDNFPPSERVLIFRIVSQLFYSQGAHFECRLFAKMAEDLEVYLHFDRCFASYGVQAKLCAENLKLCKAELLLHETYCYSLRNKQLNEAVQILLLHSGVLKSLDRTKGSKKCFDRACDIFRHKNELSEIEQVFGYCTLLSIISRPEVIDSVFQNLVSKLGNETSYHIVCMVLLSYASFHISQGKLNCAIPLLQYLKNAPRILIEPYRSKALRMLAWVYLRLDDAEKAVELYRVIIGKEIKFSNLSERAYFEDVYNYILVLVKRRFFGSAYDIVKSLSENLAKNVSNESHKVKVLKMLMYLRSVISKCKPNSGHYRAAHFL